MNALMPENEQIDASSQTGSCDSSRIISVEPDESTKAMPSALDVYSKPPTCTDEHFQHESLGVSEFFHF